MSLLWRTGLVALIALTALFTGRAGGQELSELARIGPWPTLSKPVTYDGRLWFVNSVLGVNHNSADLYSFDPDSGVSRYERHLFSQDTGDPLVSNGLLYWPSEDARFSVGWGELNVTNGRDWTSHVVPTAQIFHIHAMAAFKGQLIAASSAWRAGLHVSNDGGATWGEVYDHPTPDRRVSRIVTLAATDDLLFAHIIDLGHSRLLRFDGTGVDDVSGWPIGQRIDALATLNDRVFALVAEANGTALWSSDGSVSARIREADQEWRAVDLTAAENALWAVTQEDDGGRVWRSEDGRTWEPVSQFAGGRPRNLIVHDGDIYVLGGGDDGRGILWGPDKPRPIPPVRTRPDLPRRPPVNWVQAPDWTAEIAGLKALLADRDTFRGRGVLRDRSWQNVTADAPDEVFEVLLDAPVADRSMTLIGGATTASAERMVHWIALWAMAAAERGRVPQQFLSLPFHSSENGAEKYFDLAPAAMWTVAMIGQRDPATIDALIERLDRADEPDWLRGDIVGALSAVTAQKFGYDTDAWRAWWHDARPD